MWEASSGAGLAGSSSDMGISTSTVPTLYGPVYSGKPGMGFRRERYADSFWLAAAMLKNGLRVQSRLRREAKSIELVDIGVGER